MEILLDELQAALHRSAVSRLLLAYSGGLDSSCLLHAVTQLRKGSDFQIRAIHINHGIHPESDEWQRHCEQTCTLMGIELVSERLELGSQTSEDDARRARYKAFEAALRRGETLLMAHHLDDQLETLLLRLARGSGLSGLSGMPHERRLGHGQLLRPWITLKRSDLQRYAEQEQLHWVEDTSNSGVLYDRNYCRNQLLPLVEQRWPAYRESWSKSQTLLAESAELLAELARDDVSRLSESGQELDLTELQTLSPVRQRNALRHWLSELGLELPGWQQLHQLQNEFIAGRSDSRNVFDLGQFYIQRFQQRLYVLQHPSEGKILQPCVWDCAAQSDLQLTGNGRLLANATLSAGISSTHAGALQVRYREGGESVRLPGRPEKTLKKLLQEEHVPPWLRERLPLIFADDQLVCVPGLGVADKFGAGEGEEGWEIHWEPPESLAPLRPRESTLN